MCIAAYLYVPARGALRPLGRPKPRRFWGVAGAEQEAAAYYVRAMEKSQESGWFQRGAQSEAKGGLELGGRYVRRVLFF